MNQGHSKISKAALEILEVLIEANAVGGKTLKSKDILAVTGLPEELYDTADSFLLQQNYVEGTAGGLEGLRWLTGRGIEFYENSQNPPATIQIGAIFQGSVEQSQIQAFVSAIDSNIQQVVQSTNTDEILEVISKTIEEMVGKVKEDLNIDELAFYVQAAKDFRQEIAKERPDKSVLHRLLGILSFLGSFESTIQFGDRTLRLAKQVTPYLPVLLAYLSQLLSHPPA